MSMLSSVDARILRALHQQRLVTRLVAEEVGSSSTYVARRLRQLREEGLVRYVGEPHDALWEITDDGVETLQAYDVITSPGSGTAD